MIIESYITAVKLNGQRLLLLSPKHTHMSSFMQKQAIALLQP
jgi:hypothetical protein